MLCSIKFVLKLLNVPDDVELDGKTFKGETEAAAAANNSLANVAVLIRFGKGDPFLEFENPLCKLVDSINYD